MENSAEVPETLKAELPHCQATPLLSLDVKKNHNLKRQLRLRINSALMARASNQKLPGQMPGRKDVVSLSREIGLGQENELPPSQPRVDQEMILLTEESQTGNHNRLTTVSFRDGF